MNSINYKNFYKDIITEEEKSASLYKSDKPFDPNNPEINLHGVAVYSKKSLEANIIRKMEDLVRMAKEGDWNQVYNLIYQKHSIVQHMLKGLHDVQQELNTPQMKRKITLARRKI